MFQLTFPFRNIVFFLIFIFLCSSTFADYGEGVRGWCTPVRGSGEVCLGNPMSACLLQYAQFGNQNNRFEGYHPYSANARLCDWLTHIEGGEFTLLPTVTIFRCKPGYTFVPPGRCLKYAEKQRPVCNNQGGGSPNPDGGTDPILLSTGALYTLEEDYRVADNRFAVQRYYRSQSGGSVQVYNQDRLGLGWNWMFSFQYEVHIQPTNFATTPYVSVYLPDGSAYDFKRQNDGSMQAVGFDGKQAPYSLSLIGNWPGNLNTIVDASTQWSLVLPDDRTVTLQTFKEDFGNKYLVGRPLNIKSRTGYKLNFTYESSNSAVKSIVDSFGQEYLFHWINQDPSLYGGSKGFAVPRAVKRIDFPDNTAVEYYYDNTQGVSLPFEFPERLIGVRYLDKKGAVVGEREYQYQDTRFPYAMTGLVDERGITVSRWSYDSSLRALGSEGPGGLSKFQIAYDIDSASRALRKVTNPFGKVAEYEFERNSGALRLSTVTGKPSANCVGSVHNYQYDTEGFVEKTVDALGNQTRYEYRDPKRRLTRRIEAAGTVNERITEYSWHPSFRALTSVKTPLLESRIRYNTLGQVENVQQKDLGSQKLRSWDFAYTPEGFIESIDGPLPGTDDTLRVYYNLHGFPEQVDAPMGLRHLFQSSARGLITGALDPNGMLTMLDYDARGRATGVSFDAAGAPRKWRFVRNAAGSLIRVQRPGGSFIKVGRSELNWLQSITNSSGESIRLGRNLFGGISKVVVEDSSAQKQAETNQKHDELGRVLSVVSSLGQWDYSYDAEGNLKSIEDPRNFLQEIRYDDLNQVKEWVDESKQPTLIKRNAHGDVRRVTDVRALSTEYLRNGWGEVTEELNANIGNLKYERDERGLISKISDARGVVRDLQYDAEGRLEKINFSTSPAEDVTFQYDNNQVGRNGIGRLTRVDDSTGTLEFFYSPLGELKLEKKIQGNQTFQTEYRYYPYGDLEEIVYPSGKVVRYLRDPDGQILDVRLRLNESAPESSVVSNVSFEPFGPLKKLQFGNGLVESRSYDLDYRSQQIDLTQGTQVHMSRQYTYGDAQHITEITDLLKAADSEKYRYSPTRRLTEALGPWGRISFTYDSAGNRQSKISFDANNTLSEEIFYDVDAESDQLIASGGTKKTSWSHDKIGNVVAVQENGSERKFSYNANGRLEKVFAHGQLQATYSYDAFERLVVRQPAAPEALTTIYLYDSSDRLLAEMNADGTERREYIWLEDRPLAFIDSGTGSNPSIYYIHSDHIDRPVKVSDASGRFVWEARYRPFGEVQLNTSMINLDLRLPGQLYLSESNLSYNWHRHYDPSTGRYLQPDPIGLSGGLNRYLYANGDPVNKVDPDGLLYAQVGYGLSFLAIASGLVSDFVYYSSPLEIFPSPLVPNESRSVCSPKDYRPTEVWPLDDVPLFNYEGEEPDWPDWPEGSRFIRESSGRRGGVPSIPPWLDPKGRKNYLRNMSGRQRVRQYQNRLNQRGGGSNNQGPSAPRVR